MKKSSELPPDVPAIGSTALLAGFGARIRIARAIRNVSLRELAEKMGVTANAISKVEKGENGFSSRNLIAMSEALGIPIDWFFTNRPELLGRPIVGAPWPERSTQDYAGGYFS